VVPWRDKAGGSFGQDHGRASICPDSPRFCRRRLCHQHGRCGWDTSESREKDFLGRAGGIALSYLPKPDPAKIIEAQNPKIAVLSGQLELANRLTGDALHRAEVADQRTVRAIAGKRASDIALQEAAAEARGAEQAQFWMMLLAGSVAVLWAYTKLTHLSPGKLATIVADLRNGTGEQNQAIQIIDSATTPLQQMMTKTNVKLDAFIRKVFS